MINMNKTQKIILSTMALGGMELAGIKAELKSSEVALLQYELLKLAEEHGEEVETVLEKELQTAIQHLYKEIFEEEKSLVEMINDCPGTSSI